MLKPRMIISGLMMENSLDVCMLNRAQQSVWKLTSCCIDMGRKMH